MSTLTSYELNGKKLSFANWISNLSPIETPFVSMTGKESINQTLFQWQTDSLAKATSNAVVEGAQASDGDLRSTSIKQNNTQILRKVVKVSDTANALANYGRGKELQYQMEKAGKEIKRDLEHAFLNNIGSSNGSSSNPRITAGFRGLVAPLESVCPDTHAVVHKHTKTNALAESDLFDLTYNLYLAGSSANIIMFHPKHASFFSSLQEKGGNRTKIFENTPKYSSFVNEVVDPLGQVYKLIPNRWLPIGAIYFFNPSDWTQMVLRTPSRTKLAKDGSYEKWMIEMEVGLRHRHPFASGILCINDGAHSNPHETSGFIETGGIKFTAGTTESKDLTVESAEAKAIVGQPLSIKLKTAAISNGRLSILKNGKELISESTTTAIDWSTASKEVIKSLSTNDAGFYTVQVTKSNGEVFVSHGYDLTVGNATPIRNKKTKAVKEA